MASELKKDPQIEEHKPATEEQIREYKLLKARNEWIEANKKRLDEIERNKLFHVRWLLVVSIVNLIVSLLNFYLLL